MILFLLFAACRVQAEEPISGGTQPLRDKSPAATVFHSTRTFSFESDTVWGHIQVRIETSKAGFRGRVDSGPDLTGWTLADEKTGSLLSKGGLNPTTRFQFQVRQSFQGPYRLTLFLRPGKESVPVALTLRRPRESRPGLPLPVEAGDYRENPEHPYDLMVKSLYERAVTAYHRGDSQIGRAHV